MGGRDIPLDCPACGGVADWGDFGPDPEDSQAGITCVCDQGPVRLGPYTAAKARSLYRSVRAALQEGENDDA